jgi:hypothetical protein
MRLALAVTDRLLAGPVYVRAQNTQQLASHTLSAQDTRHLLRTPFRPNPKWATVLQSLTFRNHQHLSCN